MTVTSVNNQHDGPLLGCIADDVTGATDLATNLAQAGMRVVQFMGVPENADEVLSDVDAVVVALKTRAISAADAIDQSLSALAFLQRQGIDRFYFKYCSTFDSTPDGNIGPVAGALMNCLRVSQIVFCPAFPEAGRTVYRGHLFVHDQLLHESGMQHHPLNPMHDANLVRVLDGQASHCVGLLASSRYGNGVEEVRQALAELKDSGIRFVIADACDNFHLQCLAAAVVHDRLVTGGSGLGKFLALALRDVGLLKESHSRPTWLTLTGRNLIVAGSCSTATNAQVAWMQDRGSVCQVDVQSVMTDSDSEAARIINWASNTDPRWPLLIASTSAPENVAALQKQFGVGEVAAAVETFLAMITARIVKSHKIRSVMIAGGETSGAILQQLQIHALQIGPEICTGVPWTQTIGREQPLNLALKSGNFGGRDFFETALRVQP